MVTVDSGTTGYEMKTLISSFVSVVVDSLEGGVRGDLDQNPLSEQVGILAVSCCVCVCWGGGVSGNR